ncbi:MULTISPECIES: siderophore-interacting protein [unclassified Streptomyces]|uniref:siderophore-interacting protein n=1 Tax=unclassified Streptomyces TaxID=2593676 RepID=UPI001BE72ED7|nr:MULTISPECIES: siderophore-interacting protein [unclassified Streptomyces]MBT2403725.1 siderophore-interacting protein [Streptomyces sp. ISL-21]MBT2459743.1 siderophore-interacting protein [Streptomyces sp. ISL-86]MBT2611218.1 siderophore-interacting protein [Streptomyces sp. ISL-87]
MAEGRARKVGTAVVVRTERLSPHMVRLVLGGEGLAGFGAGEFTDHYVKVLFAPEGVRYAEPWDLDEIRSAHPRGEWPRQRAYTVRCWDPAHQELTLDFVVHGDEGLAGPWAARVQPGETVRFLGPGGAYTPEPSAGWHLLAGDESALPAIAAAMERIPAGARVHAFVEIDGPDDEQKVATPDGVVPVWLHRAGRPVGEALVEAVTALEFPSSDVHAFVHGEAGFVKELRRHLRLERGIPRERLSISGYWRLGETDEGWRAIKRDWNAEVLAEQDQAA